ncbi:hypothetical protein MML48_4g00013485 [Holotrichia oblita]|uniref:Uncharacterized protein n=1 Tax=Holotrichia oblita TaxID=644536 RepID=A0ACB9T6H6_HOLOL|nr:hypothetical protein MML48_4g00013485 [Holotrichia oblita]
MRRKYKFEQVQTFKYLGKIISNKNDRSIEIVQRIKAGHNAYYRYKDIMRSKKISRKTKLKVYKAAIRPTVLYAAETMRITNKDAENVRDFERKIIRRIYGPKKIDEDQYRRLTNQEIREILNGEDIVKEIKSRRIRWYGHINRKDEESITNNEMETSRKWRKRKT